MESPSQILTMRAPAGDWTGLARRPEQWLGERAAAANMRSRFVAGNYTDLQCSGTATLISGHASAGNDAACGDPIPVDDVEPWARHALAANGFGDAGIIDATPRARPTSYEMYHAARAHRSFILGRIIITAIEAVRAFASRALARHRQRGQVMAADDALRQLDDGALRDLGFDRSEISSIAAEVAGDVDSTRVRSMLLPRHPSR